MTQYTAENLKNRIPDPINHFVANWKMHAHEFYADLAMALNYAADEAIMDMKTARDAWRDAADEWRNVSETQNQHRLPRDEELHCFCQYLTNEGVLPENTCDLIDNYLGK